MNVEPGNDPYDAVIADLEAQIERLQGMAEELRHLRGVRNGSPSASAASRVPANVTFGHDAFFQMKAADAARKYLQGIKKTATATAIGEALVAGGWKTTAKNVPETIRSILGRTEGFVKINGEIGLAEWYPGRKTVSKARPLAHTDDAAQEGESGVEDSMGVVIDG